MLEKASYLPCQVVADFAVVRADAAVVAPSAADADKAPCLEQMLLMDGERFQGVVHMEIATDTAMGNRVAAA
jgi:hypothetical protein